MLPESAGKAKAVMTSCSTSRPSARHWKATQIRHRDQRGDIIVSGYLSGPLTGNWINGFIMGGSDGSYSLAVPDQTPYSVSGNVVTYLPDHRAENDGTLVATLQMKISSLT